MFFGHRTRCAQLQSRIGAALVTAGGIGYRRRSPVDDYDSLIRSVVAGDRAAWPQLVGALAPQIRRMAASHKSMRARHLSRAPDDVSEVTTSSLERLSRDGFHNLRRYLVQRERLGERAQSFDSWLNGAVDFTIREHLRRRTRRGQSTPPAG